MSGVRRAILGIHRSPAMLWLYRARISSSFMPRTFSSKNVEDEWVEDFNRELETVFGRQSSQQRGELATIGNLEAEEQDAVRVGSLTHVDAAGKAAMVNVANKADTQRVAVASGKVFLGLEAFELVASNNIAKGDVLTVAKIAGIHGAKQTSSLIPLCHNILLQEVDVTLTLDGDLHAVDIRAKATASGPTGVEMEALTAVSVAGLAVYDMCKAVSKDIRISNVQLESKTGGKSGDWFRYEKK